MGFIQELFGKFVATRFWGKLRIKWGKLWFAIIPIQDKRHASSGRWANEWIEWVYRRVHGIYHKK